jgi:tripartite-type tricarboxylate transporter receptor subunit TctC
MLDLGLGGCMRRLAATFLACTLCIVAALAHAQQYPTKPITLLVGYPPGGSVDATARVVAERLSQMLKQPVVVANHPGATGNIAAEQLAKAAPDGYTLYVGTSINAVSVSLFKSLPYDPVKDFAPISRLVESPSILVVSPAVPARNVKELVALAKASPGKLTYATTGPGSSPHLCAELFSTLAGIKMLHVPYKGGGETMQDLISGRVDLTFSNPTSIMQLVESGRIRALAATTAKRFSQMPELPTMIDAGYPDFDLSAWYALYAPSGTPPGIIALLNADLAKILAMPDVKELLAKQGLEASPSTPEALGDELKSDIAKYAKLLRDADVQPM